MDKLILGTDARVNELDLRLLAFEDRVNEIEQSVKDVLPDKDARDIATTALDPTANFRRATGHRYPDDHERDMRDDDDDDDAAADK